MIIESFKRNCQKSINAFMGDVLYRIKRAAYILCIYAAFVDLQHICLAVI